MFQVLQSSPTLSRVKGKPMLIQFPILAVTLFACASCATPLRSVADRLEDPDRGVRYAAAQALGREQLADSPEGSALLDALLLDSDARVVARATDTAARSAREDALVLVLAQLDSRDPVVRAIAASHLPSLVGPQMTTEEAALALRAVRNAAIGEAPADARLVALDARPSPIIPRSLAWRRRRRRVWPQVVPSAIRWRHLPGVPRAQYDRRLSR